MKKPKPTIEQILKIQFTALYERLEHLRVELITISDQQIRIEAKINATRAALYQKKKNWKELDASAYRAAKREADKFSSVCAEIIKLGKK